MIQEWQQSFMRVAIHEVGHAVVGYVLDGVATDIAVYQQGGEWVGHNEPAGTGENTEAYTREDWVRAVAGLYGGWAAVHLAIQQGHLPPAPEDVEANPGDRGFLGGPGSDQYWVDHFSQKAEPTAPEAIADEGRALALDSLKDRMALVLELADSMEGFGVLPAETLREKLR